MAKRIGVNKRKSDQRRASRRPRRHWKTYAAGGAAVALAIACVWTLNPLKSGGRRVASAVNELRFFTVDKISIRGAVHVNPEELVRRCGIKLPLSLRDFKTGYLPKLPVAEPWIEKVRLVSSWGGEAVLSVQERAPVAMLQGREAVVLVDAQGVYLPLEPGVAYTLPLVSGLRDSVVRGGPGRLTKESTGRMNRFLDGTVASGAPSVRAITQAHFGEDRRVTVLFEESPTVVVVDEHAPAVCFERLRHIREMTRGDSAAPSRIDLGYRNLAFVTPAAAATGKKRNKI